MKKVKDSALQFEATKSKKKAGAAAPDAAPAPAQAEGAMAPARRPRPESRTLFLPKTDFPMRGGLPQQEPRRLARWAEMDSTASCARTRKGRARFMLHDGPPYANGHIHIGTSMNKILKDLVVRTRQMIGFDADYIPGWDCHGLPIEWKVEEEFRAKGKQKRDVPMAEFRTRLPRLRAEVDRHPAHRVQAPRRRRQLERSLSDDGVSRPRRPSTVRS